jgi:hypothetical protein
VAETIGCLDVAAVQRLGRALGLELPLALKGPQTFQNAKRTV